jgi:hypothetical protein
MSCGLDSAQPVVSAGRLEGGDATFGVAIFFGLATPMAPIVSRYLLLRGSTEPLIKHISADICLQKPRAQHLVLMVQDPFDEAVVCPVKGLAARVVTRLAQRRRELERIAAIAANVT